MKGVDRPAQVAERRVDVGIAKRHEGDVAVASVRGDLRRGRLPRRSKLLFVFRHREIEIADLRLVDVVQRDRPR